MLKLAYDVGCALATRNKLAASALRSRIQIVHEPLDTIPGQAVSRWRMLFNGKPIGKLRTSQTGTGARVEASEIDPEYQGLGLGKKMYGEVMRRVPHRVLQSGESVSNSAGRVWESMTPDKKYTTYRHPKARGDKYGNRYSFSDFMPGAYSTNPKHPNYWRGYEPSSFSSSLPLAAGITE